jgi:arylsulfatase A-like enzyme
MKFLTLLIFYQAFLFMIGLQGSHEKIRPNILWLVVEDQSKHYGFNGEKLVHTPVLDELAGNGVRFTNASVTAPVCSTARSALITGMFQTSIGAHHHRSGRGAAKIKIPNHIKLIPNCFRKQGTTLV